MWGPPCNPPSTHQAPQEFRSTSVEVRNLLKVLDGEMSRKEMQEELGLKDKRNFRENYLNPSIAGELIQMMYPENPTHSKQKYFITDKGKTLVGK
jgi:hypothetical protein